ncbi:hypothetical protein [Halocynthiibacter sp.]|uniref:hypothetical protein n=1 Tax=Halocynthiibacter sp. TaxID=1979210 RepID=UPI003C5C18CD
MFKFSYEVFRPHRSVTAGFVMAAGICAALPAMADNFTTAGEVRPILTATRTSWVQLRERNGQDMLDFSQLGAWRCGLRTVHYRVNGGAEQQLEMENCYEGDLRPNAVRDTAAWAISQAGGSVQNVDLRVTYDDGREDSVRLDRASIQR